MYHFTRRHSGSQWMYIDTFPHANHKRCWSMNRVIRQSLASQPETSHRQPRQAEGPTACQEARQESEEESCESMKLDSMGGRPPAVCQEPERTFTKLPRPSSKRVLDDLWHLSFSIKLWDYPVLLVSRRNSNHITTSKKGRINVLNDFCFLLAGCTWVSM